MVLMTASTYPKIKSLTSFSYNFGYTGQHEASLIYRVFSFITSTNNNSHARAS